MASGLILAAKLPGEGDILAAVAACPADDTARLVYADWLDEHSDPRGAYLRQYVAAVKAGREPPRPPDGFSAGWLEIVGVTLTERLRELGVVDYRTAVLSAARPAVAVFATPDAEPDPDSRFALGASKFGGRPDLPRGTEWPRCEVAPLEFLGQLDLAEVSRTVAGRALPATGLLSFFMYHDHGQDVFGSERYRGVPGGLQIIHTPAGADLGRLDVPDDLTRNFGRPHRPCRLTFQDAMDVTDSASGWPTLDESLRPAVFSDADHKLFGYSHVSVLASDPTPGPEWEQLAQLSSDRDLHWNWGDGHQLFWYIRTADLRAGRFDDTTAIDG
jgi:uncharacterized protein (TIGR02996 family)